MVDETDDSRARWLPGCLDEFSSITWKRLLALWLAISFALIVNRGPIFFSDTTAYIRTADAAAVTLGAQSSEWSARLNQLQVASAKPSEPTGLRPTPLAGRSIYYGAILWLLGIWGAVLSQGLVASVAVLLVHRRLGSSLPFLALPLFVALSSATVFAALLMPDLIAALSLLALAMILPGWGRMPGPQRAFWFSVMLLGALAHTATLLIVALVTTTCFLVWRKRLIYLPVLAVMALGVVGEVGFSMSVKYVTGQPPLRPPFLSARLIDDGPGLRYLEARCPSPTFALCDFYRALPGGSDAMLWSKGGNGFISMSPERQRAWSEQDLRFALAVVDDRPLEALTASLGAVGRQLGGFSLDDITSPLETADMLPQSAHRAYADTLVASNTFPTIIWNGVSLPLLFLSMLLLAHRRRDLPIEVKIALLSVAADILICGALSTPHDRYLMRVAWLLPIMALSFVPVMRPEREKTST